MQYNEIIQKIKSLANPKNVAGMARFGINPANTYGVSVPVLRKMAREAGRDHELALELWASGIHEARLLACLIDRPDMVTGEQMENWVKDFDSWDVCDQCCSNLFDRTPAAHEKAVAWCEREEEFVRRAGFVLMACLAVHDKKADDQAFVKFMSLMKKYATDERNFVKKAVNWALRQIGKRNINLNKAAIAAAEDIKQIDSKSARWIASDAIRELTGEKVQRKLAGVK
ncbi:MAG: DNA alkylation repair protein [Dehalococcoidales bacterium]